MAHATSTSGIWCTEPSKTLQAVQQYSLNAYLFSREFLSQWLAPQSLSINSPLHSKIRTQAKDRAIEKKWPKAKPLNVLDNFQALKKPLKINAECFELLCSEKKMDRRKFY